MHISSILVSQFLTPNCTNSSKKFDFYYCFTDKYLGEMFLNFPLNPTLATYSGIDLSPFEIKLEEVVASKVGQKRRCLGRWERCWMGLRPSSYWCVRFYYLAEEFARANHSHSINALRWDKVRLNLPGSHSFNPTLPWIMKWDSHVERIVGDIVSFIDDLRISGFDEEAVWSISIQVLARLQYFGIQHASRNISPPIEMKCLHGLDQFLKRL